MKKLLPVLAVFAGLGSSISFSQGKHQADPFGRYLTGIKANHPEAALVRFADECSVNIKTTEPWYADRPDNTWVQVKDLGKGIHGLETDFFATVAVWKQSDRILVEMWVMELDIASESRSLYCLDKRNILLVESSDWALPITGQGGSQNPGWGYEQRWKMSKTGKFERFHHGFVDSSGVSMASPKLDDKTRKSLDGTPLVRSWNDLQLPTALLQ